MKTDAMRVFNNGVFGVEYIDQNGGHKNVNIYDCCDKEDAKLRVEKKYNPKRILDVWVILRPSICYVK
jgi:hypothetical protein